MFNNYPRYNRLGVSLSAAGPVAARAAADKIGPIYDRYLGANIGAKIALLSCPILFAEIVAQSRLKKGNIFE